MKLSAPVAGFTQIIYAYLRLTQSDIICANPAKTLDIAERCMYTGAGKDLPVWIKLPLTWKKDLTLLAFALILAQATPSHLHFALQLAPPRQFTVNCTPSLQKTTNPARTLAAGDEQHKRNHRRTTTGAPAPKSCCQAMILVVGCETVFHVEHQLIKQLIFAR
jgi:hypothetical protein